MFASLLHHHTLYLHICCILYCQPIAYTHTSRQSHISQILARDFTCWKLGLSERYQSNQAKSSRCRCLLSRATRPTKGLVFLNKAARIWAPISLINSSLLIQSTMKALVTLRCQNRRFWQSLLERIISEPQLQACLAKPQPYPTIRTTPLRQAVTSTQNYLGELQSLTVSFSASRISP